MAASLRERHLALKEQHGGEWFDFEQIVREVYLQSIREGDTAVDAGANFGSHTTQIAERVGKTGKVLAIEAVPAVAQTLQRSIVGGYGHLAARIEVINRAVSDSSGWVELYHVPSNHSLSSLRNRPNVAAEKSLIMVEAVRIDDVLPANARVSFMKLDVEGAELAALKGAKRTLDRHHPVVTFEFDTVTSGSFGNTAGDYLALASELGYRIFDPFGTPMLEPAQFMESLVWDYIAMNLEPERELAILAALRRYMATHFGLDVEQVARL